MFNTLCSTLCMWILTTVFIIGCSPRDGPAIVAPIEATSFDIATSVPADVSTATFSVATNQIAMNVATDEMDTDLFTTANIQNLTIPAGPAILRSRLVTIDFDLLARSGNASSTPAEISDTITLNLFDDASFTARLDRVEPNQSGGYTWFGYLEGGENSQVILMVKEGILAGNVTYNKAQYQIRHLENDVYAIHQIDQSAFPDEDEPSQNN